MPGSVRRCAIWFCAGAPAAASRVPTGGSRARTQAKEEIVLRNAKGFLNKLTLEKFETLSNQLLDVGIDG